MLRDYEPLLWIIKYARLTKEQITKIAWQHRLMLNKGWADALTDKHSESGIMRFLQLSRYSANHTSRAIFREKMTQEALFHHFHILKSVYSSCISVYFRLMPMPFSIFLMLSCKDSLCATFYIPPERRCPALLFWYHQEPMALDKVPYPLSGSRDRGPMLSRPSCLGKCIAFRHAAGQIWKINRIATISFRMKNR